MEYTAISPNINIIINNNNNNSLSSSSSQLKLISQSKQQQISRQQPPPDILSSIDQLREFSTALSAFLHDFDDLRSHITSITSAIDAQLPPHLLNTNAAATTTEGAIYAERNPNGTEKGNGELRHANNDELKKVVEESNDKLEGIDVFEKKKESDSLVSEEDIYIWKMIEDIDCDDDDVVSKKKKRKEAYIIDKFKVLLKEPEKSGSLRKAEEAIYAERNPNGTEKGNSELRHANNDELRKVVEESNDKLEGIDVLEKKKEKEKESDSLVSEEDIDIWKMIEYIDCDDDDVVSKKKKKKRKEADIIDKFKVLLKEPEKSGSLRKAEEAIYAERNPNGTEKGNNELRHANNDELRKVVEDRNDKLEGIDVLEKKKEKEKESDSLVSEEDIDIWKMIEDIDCDDDDVVSKKKKKKRKEADIIDKFKVLLKEPEKSGSLRKAEEAIYAERNPNGTEKGNSELRHANNDELRKVVEDSNDKLEGIDVLEKKKEKEKESDSLVSEEDIDIWKMIEDIDCDDDDVVSKKKKKKKRKETDIIDKFKVLLKEPEKSGSLRKAEEAIYAERNPNGTEKGNSELRHANNDELRKVVEDSNDKLEGIDVLEKKEKEKESDSLVSEEDIDIWKMIEDIDCDDDDVVSKKKKKKKKEAYIIDKFKVLLKEPEKSGSLRKAEEIEKSKEEDQEIDVAKEPEKSDGFWEEGEIDISKEEDREIDVAEKKKKKKKKREEKDISKEDGEIEILEEEDREIEVSKKKPEEEIDISKEDGEIEMSKESDEIAMSKKQLEEIIISKKKKHKEIDIYREADEICISKKKKHEEIRSSKRKHEEIDKAEKKHDKTDALKRPAEIDVSKKPDTSDTLWKPEAEIDMLKKPKEREMSKEDGEDDTFKRPVENDASKKLVENDVSNKPEEIDVLNQPKEVDVLNKPEEIHVSKKPDEVDVSNKPKEIDVSNKADEIDASKKPVVTVFEFLCKEMRAKKMRKYVLAHISEMNSLHQEIAKALKLAINPAKLVLDSIGMFFLETSRAYYYGKSRRKQIAAKQAGVLILECFVMISGDGIEITKEDKEYAENAAIDWKKRMIKEGRLIYMEEVDARGLLLFISGFGIPDGVFSNEDFRDLIRASNVKEISNALRHSTILIPKLPEVIDWMVKSNLEIEAADITYTFGLENKCHKPQKETDVSKKTVEINVLNQPEEVDVLNKPEEIDVSKNPDEIDVSNKPEEIGLSNKPEEIGVSNKPEKIDVSNKADEIGASKKPAIAVLEFLCTEMCAKELKKHVLAHISEMNSLHQEIAMALKLAINPAKLVLDSIGRFFLQTSRAYYYHKQIVARQAAVLILECFVMISSDGIKITKENKQYAKNAAIGWKKRMINEGGLIYMEAVDARGLLLFISGFGIPDGVFSNEDLRDLIRASNVKEISNAVRHSTILIPKLPEVINWMVKNNLEIEAADIAYTFGLENKCHKPQEETDASKKIIEIDVLNKPEEIDVSSKADEFDASKKPAIAVLEFLCKQMWAKKMKEHVLAHISEMNPLHQEIAKALKLAINPAKLVLDSIGRFFLLTRKAYTYWNSRQKQIVARQAAVLILECFVMISGDGIDISQKDKEYAENAAIDWRKRMIKEGGLLIMKLIDARGLLLFISGFGIPDGVFSNEDIRDLIRASKVEEISNALRHSTILIPKLPEVIDWMVKNNLEIEAADYAYTFGLEDKCHPETILMTFLHNKIKDTHNGSSIQVNAATMQQLSDLKSIRHCLVTHKIDPSKFFPGVKINEKIEQLEKVINELDLKSTEEKSTLKRKEKETEFSKDLNHQQAKRSCFSHENLPHKQNSHDHDGIRPSNRSTQPSHSYFDRNRPNNYVTTSSASSVFSPPVLPPNITSSVPGGLAGSYGPCVYVGPVAEPMAHMNNPWPYGWHGGQPYSRQSQAYNPHPSTAGFYGRPPWQAPAVSFPGLPDHSLPVPGGFFGRPVLSSDLYRFADTFVERGSHCGPRG